MVMGNKESLAKEWKSFDTAIKPTRFVRIKGISVKKLQ